MDRPLRLVRPMCCALGCAALGAGAAQAQDYGDPSGKTLTVAGDIRLVGVDGERSWIDGDFGKARFGGKDDDFRVAAHAVEGEVIWQPQLSWSFGMTLAALAQAGQEHAADLSEAYLSWRRDPHGRFRLSARAGLFWPPVSLEHSGPAWTVTETITPSAINSWIGEEVKVTGTEATGSFVVGQNGRLSLTGALFGLNDTAGTLLAYRGWALHDEKATAFGHQRLPPLDPFSLFVQAAQTKPVDEIDHRPGYYLRLGWSPGPALKIHVFHYDNRGNPEAVDANMQWGWRTRFTELGGAADLGARTRITLQALAGRTTEGFAMPDRRWSDTLFRSAFALVTRRVGAGSVSGRVEAFGTTGRGSVLDATSSERGWATTLAASRPLGDHATILAEALHIDSERRARAQAGIEPQQYQTIVQLALRLHN